MPSSPTSSYNPAAEMAAIPPASGDSEPAALAAEAGDGVGRGEPGGRLRSAQYYLAALGYPVAGDRDPAAAADGVFGFNTRGAILQFQADQDLDPSGQLDPETWEALADAYQGSIEAESTAPTSDEGDPLLAVDAGEARADTTDILETLVADLPDEGEAPDVEEL